MITDRFHLAAERTKPGTIDGRRRAPLERAARRRYYPALAHLQNVGIVDTANAVKVVEGLR